MNSYVDYLPLLSRLTAEWVYDQPCTVSRECTWIFAEAEIRLILRVTSKWHRQFFRQRSNNLTLPNRSSIATTVSEQFAFHFPPTELLYHIVLHCKLQYMHQQASREPLRSLSKNWLTTLFPTNTGKVTANVIGWSVWNFEMSKVLLG